MKNILFILIVNCLLPLNLLAKKKAEPIIVKVAVVYENPQIRSQGNKHFHECIQTPKYNRAWNDPKILAHEYKNALEEISHGVVKYEIVQEIEADHLFTYLRNDPLKRLLTVDQMYQLLSEPNWATLKEVETTYDYNAMVEYYGFDKMRDKGEIHEVWIWSFPFGGMYESHMMGKDAFWLNSNPNSNPTCKEHLCIMGLNYERDLACALESYGHRFESVMMEVFGWWNYEKKNKKEELTMWERYAGYIKNYDKFDKGQSNIGNIHFPPNGEKDYDWKNPNKVYTYADEWFYYPNVKEKKGRLIDCSEWGCSHLGYMKWWFTHIPCFEGINKKDGKLNNWWHYVVDYKSALQLEQKLKE